jgi:hypothetical protein
MGKEVNGSETAFGELKIFTDKYYAGKIPKNNVFKEAYRQLSSRGVRLRQDNGKDPKMTVSVPKVGNVLVIGIRYKKDDGRNTEDHFIFRPNTNIYRCKGKELDKIYPEYAGSHVLQI